MKRTLLALSLLIGSSGVYAESLDITPSTFDFGWAPVDAKISAEFNVKNQSTSLIPVTAVSPSCGCTASDFKPADLNANESLKFSLTFDTRGYSGRAFSKKTTVETDAIDKKYSVLVVGVVNDSNSLVYPEGSGVVGYISGSDNAKTVSFLNKTGKKISVSMVQSPASWAKAEIKTPTVESDQNGKILVTAQGSFEKDRHTSATFLAVQGPNQYRFTVAIRTGKSGYESRKITFPAASK